MERINNNLVIRQDDYDYLLSYIRSGIYINPSDRGNATELFGELKKATLVEKEEFPGDVVRLDSRVMIREEQNKKVIELTLVTPDKADIKTRKISVLAPLGTALIGFKKGQRINWNVPSGKKTFTIIDVINHA